MWVRTFNVEDMSDLTFEEYKFVGALITEVLIKRSYEDPGEVIKRKRIDILADEVLKNES